MSYIHNCIHKFSPSQEEKGVFEKTTHISIEGKKFNKQIVALTMSQISSFWTAHNLRPFLHSVSKVAALGVVISLTSVYATFAVAVEPETKDPDLTFLGIDYPPHQSSDTDGVKANVNSAVGFAYGFIDAADNASAATWYYLNDSTDTKTLNVKIQGSLPIPNLSNNGISSPYRIYIAAGLRTLSTDGIEVDEPYSWALKKEENGEVFYVKGNLNGEEKTFYMAADPAKPSTYFSKGASGYSLNITLGENSAISTKLHGARNDLYGANSSTDGDPIGAANKNSVNVTFNLGSTLFSQIIFGGRSAQRESVKAYTGSETDENSVVLMGNTLKGKNAFSYEDPSTSGNAEMIMRAGIWGAEGWQTNQNYVRLEDITVVAQKDTYAHWGIIGGRGFFQKRMNLKPDVNGQSSISDNNIVVIKNSIIGFKNQFNSWGQNDDGEYGNYITQNSPKEPSNSSGVIHVYGGYSVGTATDNVVIIDNSQISGNVYGGFELQNTPKGNADNPNTIRNLNPNLVSLHNVRIAEGHSFYGSATADLYKGTTEANIDRTKDWLENNQITFDESKLFPVNRRRGVAYLAGEVETDSAYVRYIHFGQFFDNSTNQKTNVSIAKSYYPHLVGQAGLPEENNDNGVIRITDVNNEKEEGIAIGQQVAGSYLLSRKGFHSDLSPSANESDTTQNMHNFWVGAYVNLLGTINGDGTSLNTKVQLFSDGKVNHNYSSGQLSILALDDGYVFAQSGQERPWMELFRDKYTNESGRVLYLGVSQAKTNQQAVNINFAEIQKFRNTITNQKTNSFGNTQVGIWVNAIGENDKNEPYRNAPVENGNLSTNWEEMVIHVPGFVINQGNVPTGLATVGFYKYLHFDGKFEDSTQIKSTATNTEGGVGLKYWLEAVNVLPGQFLVLNGSEINSTPEPNKETFTLSAYLTGRGGIEVPENNKVIVGNENQPSLATTISGDGGVAQTKVGENTYTGATILRKSAFLVQNTDGALGSEQRYTQNLYLEDGTAGNKTTYDLHGHVQTVGGLNVGNSAVASFSSNDKAGHLTVNGNATVNGNLEGSEKAKLTINRGVVSINSDNKDFGGVVELISSVGELNQQKSLVNALAVVSTNSSLYFNSAQPAISSENSGIAALALTKEADPRSSAYIRGIQNAGEVYLSSGSDKMSNLNHVNVSEAYEGQQGSVIHYRGLVQGPENSYVDVVHSATATGTSTVSFGDDHSKIPVSGIFKEARGEKTLKSEGIPIFVIADKGEGENQLKLEMQPFGVVAKDDEAYKWIYSLGYNDEEQGTQRTWVLYNSDDKDHYEPLVPPKEEENLVLRPEAGAYVGASQSWAKMHMRLHDRFGQAYYIDPFDGEEKPAAAWVRQVGSHSHFRMAGGQSKTHSNTAVTQIGGDLLRNEFNEDWKYIGGVFAGGLYNRSDSRSWDSAKSRSDGYSLGIYGTLYTGNSPDDGFYVDSWLLFGRYDNKIWSDEISSFKFKSHGWVWSVETGYTIPIGESGTKDYNKLVWTFQPEAQLVWDGVKANSATDSFGTKYRQLGTDNVTLRVGARLHANYMNKGLGFIEGNWIHNSKKAGVQMGTDKVYMDGGRNLGEFRMGLEGHLSRNTLGWATVGVQAGKAGYHNETAQIGIKYMF